MKVKMDGFHKLHEDLEKTIEKEDGNSTATSDSDEPKVERPSFREKVLHVVTTNKFQIGVVCMVILDCLLVITELLLDLVELPSHEDNIAPHVIHYISISILCLFVIEIGVRIYAMRLDFLKHKLEVFDAIVVVVSLILDLVFRATNGPEVGIGLLVILRLWRVTRILNAIVLSVKTQSEKKLFRERQLREACEQELEKFRECCSNQEREIEALREVLKAHGIEDLKRNEKPAVVSTIDVVAEVNEPPDKSSPPGAI